MIRPISMNQSTAAISILDAALDLAKAQAEKLAPEVDPVDPLKVTEAKSKWEKYCEERTGNPAAFRLVNLPEKEGQRFTVFDIGVIPPGELNRIEDECRVGRPEPKLNELRWRCFLASVRGIQGWGGSDAEIPTVNVGGVKYVDPSWLSRMFAGSLRKVALDIGAQAWAWNQVLEVEIKN